MGIVERRVQLAKSTEELSSAADALLSAMGCAAAADPSDAAADVAPLVASVAAQSSHSPASAALSAGRVMVHMLSKCRRLLPFQKKAAAAAAVTSSAIAAAGKEGEVDLSATGVITEEEEVARPADWVDLKLSEGCAANVTHLIRCARTLSDRKLWAPPMKCVLFLELLLRKTNLAALHAEVVTFAAALTAAYKEGATAQLTQMSVVERIKAAAGNVDRVDAIVDELSAASDGMKLDRSCLSPDILSSLAVAARELRSSAAAAAAASVPPVDDEATRLVQQRVALLLHSCGTALPRRAKQFVDDVHLAERKMKRLAARLHDEEEEAARAAAAGGEANNESAKEGG